MIKTNCAPKWENIVPESLNMCQIILSAFQTEGYKQHMKYIRRYRPIVIYRSFHLSVRTVYLNCLLACNATSFWNAVRSLKLAWKMNVYIFFLIWIIFKNCWFITTKKKSKKSKFDFENLNMKNFNEFCLVMSLNVIKL